jgi:hypothetical protein
MTIEDIEVGVEYEILRMLESNNIPIYATFDSVNAIQQAIEPLFDAEGKCTRDTVATAMSLYHNYLVKAIEQVARGMTYAAEQSPVPEDEQFKGIDGAFDGSGDDVETHPDDIRGSKEATFADLEGFKNFM